MKKIAALLMSICFAVPLFAETATKTTFQQRHPRRAEVNHRERKQHARIRQGVKNGSLTPEEAKDLRKNDREIKKEERDDVKANGGYLTKDQQKDINQQLNDNSKEIYKDKHN